MNIFSLFSSYLGQPRFPLRCLQCFDPWYSWCTVQGATSRCVDTGVTMGHLAALATGDLTSAKETLSTGVCACRAVTLS